MRFWWSETFLQGFVSGLMLCFFLAGESFAAPLTGDDHHHYPVVICAESVWCSVAESIGSGLIKTESLLSVPGMDPHHFQLAPSQARILAKADLMMMTGAGYDQWAADHSSVQILNAEHYTLYHPGDDPHLFFDPEIVFSVAQAFSVWLSDKEPEKKAQIEAQFREFSHSFNELSVHIQKMRRQILNDPAGRKIAVLEPAGQRLLTLLGFDVINEPWALDIMAGHGGTARDMASLEQAIEQKKIRFLVINPSVRGNVPQHIEDLAHRHNLAFVSIGEIMPVSYSWKEWMEHILGQIEQALSMPSTSTSHFSSGGK